MAKIAEVQEVDVNKLIPYERNAKQHSDEQVEKICNSIREFGFISPCLIDNDHNVIAGHGRIMAAKKLGMKTVPCLFVEGLTDEQRKAYTLADNRLTELGEWDMVLVQSELADLELSDFDVSLTGFDSISVDNDEWFDREEKDYDAREEGNEEYNDFLEKFETKKTTDDCYTPEAVYDAVAGWVEKEYGVDRKLFSRPFYPGGDYQHEEYKPGAIVVDNPPFSILAEILKWYIEKGIKFFLFGPTLTLFSSSASRCCSVPVGASVVYENGASVNTSFLTNLEPEGLRMRTAPDLYKAVQEASDSFRDTLHKELPKYSYPDEVITSAMVARWSHYGIDFKLMKAESACIDALDAQKEAGKAIYGKGFLLSKRAAAERAAAERAAATRWILSDREQAIVESLSTEGGAVDG